MGVYNSKSIISEIWDKGMYETRVGSWGRKTGFQQSYKGKILKSGWETSCSIGLLAQSDFPTTRGNLGIEIDEVY